MRRRNAALLAALGALLVAAPAQAADYVGLGDSYSSGTGTADSYPDNCQRTALAYPTLVDAQLQGTGVNLSCSGARTQNITTEAQAPGNTVPQIDVPGALTATTKYVTLQIGGNDAGFVDTLTTCAIPFGGCDQAIADAEQTALVELPPKLNATYDAVRAKAPNATIVVVGYPRIFRPQETCNLVFSGSEVNDLNAASDLLSDSLRTLAHLHDFAYVDARPVYIGHGACDSVEWINGVSFGQTANSYHPKAVGHSSGYGPIVLAGIQNVPETGITSAPSNPSNAGSPQFQMTSSVAGSSFQCKLDGGSFSTCTSPKQYPNIGEGSHTVQIRAVNANGDVDQFPESRTWVVDTTAPVVALGAGGPSGTVTTASADFTFTNSDPGATVQCRLDGGPFGACVTHLTGLSDGAHTFTVRATDAAGNVGSAARSWTVDTTPPHAAINHGPTDPTQDSTASFEFSFDDPATQAECRLDSTDEEDYQPCESPQAYADLAQGDHVFEVRGADAAGNVGPVQSFTWNVSLTAPTATITSEPDPLTKQDDATFGFVVDDPISTIRCSLDGGDFVPCDSSTSTTYADLPDGEHEFVLHATDILSRVASDSRTWTIDTEAPGASIDDGPATVTKETSAELDFSSPDPSASVECRLDSNPFAPCDSPEAYSGLASGSHHFDVRATDPAGNVGAVASRAWLVDTIPPAARITSGKPPAKTSATTAQYVFDSDSDSTFECRIDSTDPGAFVPCSSPQPYAGLPEGSHSFDVRATDAVGNVGAPDSHAWVVDTTAPTVTFDSHPQPVESTGDAAFTFHASEPNSTFECRLDSGAPGDFFGCPAGYSGLADGPHTLEVRARDSVLNTGPIAAYSWNVDIHAPNVSIQQKPPAQSASTDAHFTFTSDEPGDYTCRLDNDPAGGDDAFVGCATPQDYAGLDQGPHTLEVAFKDLGIHTVNRSWSWNVDTVPPAITISGGPSGTVNSTLAEFSVGVTGGGTPQCRFDTGSFAPCTPDTQSRTGLPEGTHSFDVRATDLAGNTGTASRAWTIDRTPPQTVIDSAPANPSSAGDASFSFSATDQDAVFQCSLDGSLFAACTPPAAYAGLGAGDHTFRVRALDSVGNVDSSPASYAWRVVPPPAGGVAGTVTKPKPKCKRSKKKKKKRSTCRRKA